MERENALNVTCPTVKLLITCVHVTRQFSYALKSEVIMKNQNKGKQRVVADSVAISVPRRTSDSFDVKPES